MVILWAGLNKQREKEGERKVKVEREVIWLARPTPLSSRMLYADKPQHIEWERGMGLAGQIKREGDREGKKKREREREREREKREGGRLSYFTHTA